LVSTEAGKSEAEAIIVDIIVDSMVAVCTCVTASVTVLVAGATGGGGVELPPSTATTEYDCGSAALARKTTGTADATLERRARAARHCVGEAFMFIDGLRIAVK